MGAAELAGSAWQLVRRGLRNREARTVLAFSVLNAALGLLANRLLTQWVAPRPLGELYLLLNVALWLTLPSASTFLFVQRHWALARERGELRRFGRGIAAGLSAQAVVVLAGAAAAAWLGVVPPGAAVLALAIAGIAQALQQTLAQVPALERRRTLAGVLDLVAGPGRLLFLGAGALLGGTLADGRSLLQLHAIYLGAFAALVTWLAMRIGSAASARQPRGEATALPSPELGMGAAARFSLPFLGTAALTQLCTSAERFGLARLDDPAATALFVQAVGLATAAAAAATGFLGTYYYPVIHDAAAHGPDPLTSARAPLRRYLVLVAAVCCALAVGGVFGAGGLSQALFGPRYAGVARLLPWTMGGAAFFTLAQALVVVPLVLRKSLGPNLARSLPLVLYAAVLLGLRPSGDAAVAYSRVYCAAQLLYLVLMIAAVVGAARRARRSVPR